MNVEKRKEGEKEKGRRKEGRERKEERKEKIRALIITHGHLDHIGGIPYLMERMGNPPIYTREMTMVMIKKRQDEFPHQDPIDYNLVEPGDVRTLGSLKVRFFGVTHSIPDSMGVAIETPYGNIVLSGDLKLNHEKGEATDVEKT
ncbi:MAG: MBL fold metallo-hydrolase [candidate division Zixibacteria bacterium]|nr:MBL fold metallo-hydrolase [candidate division Zixibacteria bacterium]